jgi:hypothetical protein
VELRGVNKQTDTPSQELLVQWDLLELFISTYKGEKK